MSDTNDKRRVPAGELSHICAWSDEKLVKLREYKLALDLRDSRAECEGWRELHNIKEACREHAEQELAALRDAVRWRCDEAGGAGYVVRVAELLALLKDDEGGAYRRGRDIPTAEAKAVAGGDSQEPPPPVTAAPSSDYCTGCGGTRRKPIFHHCPTCNGTGSLAEGTRDQMGCAKCNGTGKANESEE